MLMKEEDKCCGGCCWFYGEDTYGYGGCHFHFGEVRECGNECDVPEEFVSKEQMRHYTDVLAQAKEVTLKPKGVDKAIDFAIQYIKIFSNL